MNATIRKALPYLLLIGLAILLLVVKKCKSGNEPPPKTNRHG
ncbi:MAG: hypothetical protein WDO19_28970 [Bacteroidota bacterium]